MQASCMNASKYQFIFLIHNDPYTNAAIIFQSTVNNLPVIIAKIFLFQVFFKDLQ